jgi:trehalose 6-phosphate phosphatase
VEPASDDLDPLLAELADPRAWTFVLDFDGTLAPIVDHPDAAVAAPGAVEALARLAEVTAVAVLSGRGLDDLTERLGDAPAGLLLVGGHGSEARRPDGTRDALTDLTAGAEALDRVQAAVAGLLDERAGWQLERKVTSLVVHHRRVAPEVTEARLPEVRAALEAATDDGPGFVVQEGKAVLELKVAGIDKGRALRWIASAASDGVGRRVLVAGDDTTDEDAFAAAADLGGLGVLVAERPVATTSARWRLRDPDRLVTLLRAVRDPLGDTPAADVDHDVWGGEGPGDRAR